jgi:5-(carboxyamino)imidazole ribonucleotide synthase
MQLHPHAKYHTYGKRARKGRKMGHVTVVAEEAGWALAEARAAAAVLRNG